MSYVLIFWQVEGVELTVELRLDNEEFLQLLNAKKIARLRRLLIANIDKKIILSPILCKSTEGFQPVFLFKEASMVGVITETGMSFIAMWIMSNKKHIRTPHIKIHDLN